VEHQPSAFKKVRRYQDRLWIAPPKDSSLRHDKPHGSDSGFASESTRALIVAHSMHLTFQIEHARHSGSFEAPEQQIVMSVSEDCDNHGEIS